MNEIALTPLELIERIAALVTPPRTHRHHCFGVLAPNSPQRAAAVALERGAALQPPPPPPPAPAQVQVQAEPACTGAGEGALGVANASPTQTEPAQPVPPKRLAHYLWAVLIARIYEVFPLLCTICGGQMRIIAFITHSADFRQILDHIGVDAEPPRITPARGPSLWDECDAQMGDGVDVEPDWDDAAQPALHEEADQRIRQSNKPRGFSPASWSSACAVAIHSLFSLCTGGSLVVQFAQSSCCCGDCVEGLRRSYIPKRPSSALDLRPNPAPQGARSRVRLSAWMSAEIGGPPPFSQTTRFALV